MPDMTDNGTGKTRNAAYQDDRTFSNGILRTDWSSASEGAVIQSLKSKRISVIVRALTTKPLSHALLSNRMVPLFLCRRYRFESELFSAMNTLCDNVVTAVVAATVALLTTDCLSLCTHPVNDQIARLHGRCRNWKTTDSPAHEKLQMAALFEKRK